MARRGLHDTKAVRSAHRHCCESAAVLSGDHAATPVLLDLLCSSDHEVASFAAGRIVGGIRNGEELIEWYQIGGNAAQIPVDGKIYTVLVLRSEHYLDIGRNFQLLALLDADGNCLDKVFCSSRNRNDGLWTEGPVHGEQDGARFIIRDPAIANGYWSFDLDYGAESYWFCSYSSEKESVTLAELSTKGACRVAVCNGKFEILWPPLKDVKEVSP